MVELVFEPLAIVFGNFFFNERSKG